MRLNIIDSQMGTGKTSYAIQEMGSNDKNYIYITPFLTEVKRVKENIKNKKFYEPMQLGNGKLKHLIDLVKNNKSVISTHALFSTANDELMELLKLNKYTLILDEVMDVIDIVNLKKDDIDILINENLISVDDFGKVTWNNPNYTGIFSDIKIMAEHNRLIMANGSLMLWLFPIDVFQCFERVYIMTYMFKGQIMKYYYDLYNIKYEYNSVKLIDNKYQLINYEDDRGRFKNLIKILEDEKLNSIGKDKNNLSLSWYEKAKESYLEILKNNIYNFFYNRCKAKSKEVLWTTFLGDRENFKKALQSKGYQSKKCFAPINSRATNEYRDRKYIAYTVNRFVNPYLKNFFNGKGVSVDEDAYALSEMLQLIFRSAIRDGKEVEIYIPSFRMRKMLEEWVNH